MEKRFKWLFILALIVIIINILIYFPYDQLKTYSDKPESWIDNNKVAIMEATKDEASVSSTGLDYFSDKLSTGFTMDGFYDGEYFTGKSFSINDSVVMSIDEDLNPDDNVIDGFILDRFEDDELFSYIFVDDDWKNQVLDSEIVHGKNFENVIKFNFTKQISKGVYMMKIKEDLSRFSNNFNIHNGGVSVGGFRKNQKDPVVVRLI